MFGIEPVRAVGCSSAAPALKTLSLFSAGLPAAPYDEAMLKIYARYIYLTALLLFIQTTAWLPFGSHGIRPDLLLLLVLHAAAWLPVSHCICLGFIIGYFFEALSGAPPGFFISTYVLIFCSIKLLCRFFNFNTLIEMFGLLLVCLVIKNILLCFFLRFIYEYAFSCVIQPALREAFFTIVFFPLFFPLLCRCINTQQTSIPDAYNHVARV